MSETVREELPGLHPDGSFVPRETDIVFGRTVVPVPLPKRKNGGYKYEYAEHGFIGDAIKLKLTSGQEVIARDHEFVLRNGLALTYGQINALAGDFYGTENPISDGGNPQAQSNLFLDAYNTLANQSSRMPKEAQDILAVLQAEVYAVNDAIIRDEDPSIAYSKLGDVSAKLQSLTLLRPKGFPSYLGLAYINWDHFGEGARAAYNAGHGEALRVAAHDKNLEYAYTLNAFADHFLEDSFSAGHLRTPRKALHGNGNFTADLCAKYMHDEDNAIGLWVKNPRGEAWQCYGDKCALDKKNKANLNHCIDAIQASADEIYQAYTTGIVPSPEQYSAWNIAPTLESARDAPQELAPLFKLTGQTDSVDRREIIKNRRLKAFTSHWWYATTAAEIALSGWWDFPILIDGPPKAIHD